MPVLVVFALAIYAAYRLGAFSALAMGVAVVSWSCMAIVVGTPAIAVCCVIAAANLGWISGLHLRTASAPEYAG